MTGGRLKRIEEYLGNDEVFCFTYGDGVANINIEHLISFHLSHHKKATLTATYPPGRFGAIEIKNNKILRFIEKPQGDGGMVNGGFFVLNKSVITKIIDDNTIWEHEPLSELALEGELMAFKHEGFWLPMDTLRDKHKLEELWNKGTAPWKVWD
jgi:glucose-1-phosphate cytidylyltransferase